jgi:hypothetical protein
VNETSVRKMRGGAGSAGGAKPIGFLGRSPTRKRYSVVVPYSIAGAVYPLGSGSWIFARSNAADVFGPAG